MTQDTKESANFYRIIGLVVDVGSEVLRDLLTTLIPLNSLAKELQTNIRTLNRLKQTGVLHKDQYDMVTSTNPNPSEFDISLLVVLLRNICPNVKPPVGGWIIKYPDSNDFSLGAELIRLRNIRNNVYAHRTSTKLNEAEFETTWKELTQVILRISKHGSYYKEKEVQKKIDSMKHRALDPFGAAETLSLKMFQSWQDAIDETVQSAKSEIIEHLNKQHGKLEESLVIMKQVQEQVAFTNLQMSGLQKELKDKDTLLQHEIIDSNENTTKRLTQNTEETHAVDATDQSGGLLNNLSVALIKLYPWLKDEMEKTSAVRIASKLLSRDHTESILNSNHRRMAVDMLLKIVIKNKTLYLKKFFEILTSQWEYRDSLQQKMTMVFPTAEEVQAFICLNESHMQYADSVQRPCHFETQDRDSLVFQVKDIVTEDSLNNNFLSKMFFSLQDHDSVCDYLHSSDLPGGAKCLIQNMEKCPISIMQTFCDMMESLGRGYVIQALDLKRKYCKIRKGYENTTSSSDEKHMFSHAIRNIERVRNLMKDVLGFIVTGMDFGSVIYHLCPYKDNSWEELDRIFTCGQLPDLLETVFIDKEIKHLLAVGDYTLRYTVFSIKNDGHETKAKQKGCLKLSLISGNRSLQKGRETPLHYNLDILCDELELSHDLIELLKRKNLVSHEVSAKLCQIKSRAARIRYLLMQISPPEIGYGTIKDHLRYSSPYLYHELDKRDQAELKREFLYQCETSFKPDYSDFESRFHFHSINTFPMPEPLSRKMKTYPSRRARNITEATGPLVLGVVT